MDVRTGGRTFETDFIRSPRRIRPDKIVMQVYRYTDRYTEFVREHGVLRLTTVESSDGGFKLHASEHQQSI